MVASARAWGHGPDDPVGTAIVTSTRYGAPHVHAWWSPYPATSFVSCDVMKHCLDYGMVRGHELGWHNQFEHLSAEDEDVVTGLRDDPFAFEKVGSMLVGPDHWLYFMIHRQTKEYDQSFMGSVRCYFRKWNYPQEHWQFYSISDNLDDCLPGRQSYTINTWHQAPPEHWHRIGYCTNGINDEITGWHLPRPVTVPIPIGLVRSGPALPTAPMPTPQQISMDNLPTGAEDPTENADAPDWCHCFPMRRRGQSTGGRSGSSPTCVDDVSDRVL